MTLTAHDTTDLARTEPAPAMVQLDDVVRVFGRGDGQVRALDGVTLSMDARHVHRDHGARRAPASRRCCSSPPGSTGRRRARSASASRSSAGSASGRSPACGASGSASSSSPSTCSAR